MPAVQAARGRRRRRRGAGGCDRAARGRAAARRRASLRPPASRRSSARAPRPRCRRPPRAPGPFALSEERARVGRACGAVHRPRSYSRPSSAWGLRRPRKCRVSDTGETAGSRSLDPGTDGGTSPGGRPGHGRAQERPGGRPCAYALALGRLAAPAHSPGPCRRSSWWSMGPSDGDPARGRPASARPPLVAPATVRGSRAGCPASLPRHARRPRLGTVRAPRIRRDARPLPPSPASPVCRLLGAACRHRRRLRDRRPRRHAADHPGHRSAPRDGQHRRPRLRVRPHRSWTSCPVRRCTFQVINGGSRHPRGHRRRHRGPAGLGGG